MKNLRRSWLLLTALFFSVFLSGCGSKYSYYLYTKNAEDAIKSGDYKKAKDLISYAYIEEKNAEEIRPNRLTWLYYRLGVIAELSKNLLHAKGYYWGDQIEKGFYKDDAHVAWLAKTGWTRLDEGKSPRSFAEILELEQMEPQSDVPEKVVEKKVVKKRQAPSPMRSYAPRATGDRPIRIDTPVTYPPEPNSKGLFRVAR